MHRRRARHCRHQPAAWRRWSPLLRIRPRRSSRCDLLHFSAADHLDDGLELRLRLEAEAWPVRGSHQAALDLARGRVATERLKHVRIGLTSTQVHSAGDMQVDQMTAVRKGKAAAEA